MPRTAGQFVEIKITKGAAVCGLDHRRKLPVAEIDKRPAIGTANIVDFSLRQLERPCCPGQLLRRPYPVAWKRPDPQLPAPGPSFRLVEIRGTFRAIG